MRALAFFDFDQTLIHGDAGPLFGRHLLERQMRDLGRLRVRARYTPYFAGMAVQDALYRVGARRRSSVVRSAYRGLRGVRADVFREELGEFVDQEVARRVYPEMVAEVRGHLEAGRDCVVVTTGMEALVERALRHFPAMDLLGCRLEERDGRFTGGVRGPLYGVDKANIVHAYCRAKGVDPEGCWAYSDHWSDVEMLEAVGHPVAVNPRGRLRREALRRGWRVMDLDDPRR